MGKSKSTKSDGASSNGHWDNIADSQKPTHKKNIPKGFYRGADQNSK